MRLQKYLASCGVASRRAAEELIAQGHVSVDGEVITEMGTQVEPGQNVCVDGKAVELEAEKHYVLYHKP
ncbi:MAG: S4 domain-containing protein, partial [Clostridia bacterium]